MSGNIGQGLLQDPVCGRLDDPGQPHALGNAGLKLPFDAELSTEVPKVLADCRNQAQVVQYPRPQAGRYPPDRFEGVEGIGLQPPGQVSHRVGATILRNRPLQYLKLEQEGGDSLTDLVMELPGDALPLLLLSSKHPLKDSPPLVVQPLKFCGPGSDLGLELLPPPL